MPDCTQFRDQLAEYAAGETSRREDGALQQHLVVCPACRAELARLLHVESALSNWPLAPLPNDLARPVLAQISSEPREADWNWLPWTVWLPALAIALALGLALAANMAGQPLLSAPLTGPGGLGLDLAQASPITELRQPLSADGRELFWAVWCGLFLTLAGLGVGLGLAASKHSFQEIAGELRERWEHLREAAGL